MKSTLHSETGIILIQVLVMAMILGLVAGLLLKVAFGTHVMISQQRLSISGKQMAEAAYIRFMTCLQGTTYPMDSGAVNCTNNQGCATTYSFAGIGATYTATINLAVGSTNPVTCKVTVTCTDCLGAGSLF